MKNRQELKVGIKKQTRTLTRPLHPQGEQSFPARPSLKLKKQIFEAATCNLVSVLQKHEAAERSNSELKQ